MSNTVVICAAALLYRKLVAEAGRLVEVEATEGSRADGTVRECVAVPVAAIRDCSRADGKSRESSICPRGHRNCDTSATTPIKRPAYCSLFRLGGLALGRSVTRIHSHSPRLLSKRGTSNQYRLHIKGHDSPLLTAQPNCTTANQVQYRQPVSLASLMAAVLAPTSVHSSSHYLAPHRDTFPAFHQQHRGSAPAPRNPFEAFASHHHSGGKSRSAAASWRHSESEPPQAVVRQPAPVRTPSPKYRRSGVSHSRTPSTSSEASTTSWRSHERSPVTATRPDVAEVPRGEQHIFLLLRLVDWTKQWLLR